MFRQDQGVHDLVADQIVGDDVDELAAQRPLDRALRDAAREHLPDDHVGIGRGERAVDQCDRRAPDAVTHVALDRPRDLERGGGYVVDGKAEEG